MGWYFIRKIGQNEFESIIFNHYCLCLLVLGEINRVASLFKKLQYLLQPLRRAVLLATLALEEGDEERAYYESFFEYLESNETFIFLDFQLEHIAYRLSSYLNRQTYLEKLAAIYTRTLEGRGQYAVEQIEADPYYIKTIQTNMYPIEPIHY